MLCRWRHTAARPSRAEATRYPICAGVTHSSWFLSTSQAATKAVAAAADHSGVEARQLHASPAAHVAAARRRQAVQPRRAAAAVLLLLADNAVIAMAANDVCCREHALFPWWHWPPGTERSPLSTASIPSVLGREESENDVAAPVQRLVARCHARRVRVERFRTCNFWPWEVRNFQPCSSSGENPGETHQNTPLTLLLTKDYRNRHSRSDHPGSRPDPTLSAKIPLPAAARYFLLQPHVSFVREFFASRARATRAHPRKIWASGEQDRKI